MGELACQLGIAVRVVRFRLMVFVCLLMLKTRAVEQGLPSSIRRKSAGMGPFAGLAEVSVKEDEPSALLDDAGQDVREG